MEDGRLTVVLGTGAEHSFLPNGAVMWTITPPRINLSGWTVRDALQSVTRLVFVDSVTIPVDGVLEALGGGLQIFFANGVEHVLASTSGVAWTIEGATCTIDGLGFRQTDQLMEIMFGPESPAPAPPMLVIWTIWSKERTLS